MLRSKEVIGLPVVTFDTGEEIGTVKDVIVNRIKKCVIGFLVRRPGWFRHLSVLPFDDVMSIQNGTVSVPTETTLIRFNKAPDEVRLLERKPLPGSALISTGGHELGVIVDFAFNDHSGKLEGFDLVTMLDETAESSPQFLPLSDHLFVGKYDVIVSEEAADGVMEAVIEIDDSAPPVEAPAAMRNADPVIKPAVPPPAAQAPLAPPTVHRTDSFGGGFTPLPTPAPSPLVNPVPAPAPAAVPFASASPLQPLAPAITASSPFSSTPKSSAADTHPFKITRNGSQLVVSYEEGGFPDELSFARLREQLLRHLADKDTDTTLCFDVTNFKFLPSIMLGLLASLRKQVTTLEILNPSRDSREVLKMMGFDKMFVIREHLV